MRCFLRLIRASRGCRTGREPIACHWRQCIFISGQQDLAVAGSRVTPRSRRAARVATREAYRGQGADAQWIFFSALGRSHPRPDAGCAWRRGRRRCHGTVEARVLWPEPVQPSPCLSCYYIDKPLEWGTSTPSGNAFLSIHIPGK